MMKLSEVALMKKVKVSSIGGDRALKRRIMDMGIIKGSEIYVQSIAPLGDPLNVVVRGYNLSIRKADAQYIEVV